MLLTGSPYPKGFIEQVFIVLLQEANGRLNDDRSELICYNINVGLIFSAGIGYLAIKVILSISPEYFGAIIPGVSVNGFLCRLFKRR